MLPVHAHGSGGRVEPFGVQSELFDSAGGEPFWCIRRRLAEWLEEFLSHEDLDVVLREAEKNCDLACVESGGQTEGVEEVESLSWCLI